MSGSVVSWIFYDGIRARFYSRSTDASTRQHLYNQLSKLVYSHQLEMIKNGEELEATMPLKEGKAIVSVFDVQRSTEIKHEKTQAFFLNVFESFLEICMRGYEHNPLRSRAFRLKETGDGFISTVGYPFLPTEARSLADSAVSTALTMLDAFNKEVEKFNYSRQSKHQLGSPIIRFRVRSRAPVFGLMICLARRLFRQQNMRNYASGQSYGTYSASMRRSWVSSISTCLLFRRWSTTH